jgi:predicted Zn-dependent protease
MRIIFNPRLLLVAVLAMFLTGCAVSRSPITGKKRAYAYTWQQEIEIGKTADAQIIAQYGVYDDEDLTAYVTRVGEKVLQNSHLRRPDAAEEYRNTQFTFRVLDSPVVNAFALPGGYVYVTRGLLAHLQNEAQLAVVLGHEVGHVVARHASQRALSGTLAQVGLIAGAIGGEMLGVDGRSILQGGGLAAQLLLLRYSRDNERESDELGVEYSAMTGYDAAEGAAFFTTLKRISEQSGASIPGFMSTHPDPGEREAKIPQMAATFSEQYQMTNVNEQGYLSAINGMVYGEDPRQGFVEGGMFHHPVLKFSYPIPSDWLYQNSPQRVVVASKEQDAFIVFDIDPEAANAADAARRLGGEEGLTVRQSGATTVNGLPAYALEADAVDQNNTALKILAYFIQYDSRVYRFIGLTTAQGYVGYQRLFQNTMRGFRRLTDQRLLNKQPLRIGVSPAARDGAFQTFLPQRLPESMSPEELAIVNQLNLGTIVSRGTILKLVQ